jgi:hypothetical protein
MCQLNDSYRACSDAVNRRSSVTCRSLGRVDGTTYMSPRLYREGFALPDALKVRFVVGTQDGARSNLWLVVVRRNDVYVSVARTGGVEKLSFHESGVCRKAFHPEYGLPEGLTDRATIKWKGAPTPVRGIRSASFVLEVGIATNTLSTALEPLRKKVTWIEPAPPEMTTVLSMFYTADSEDKVVKATEPHGRVLSYTTPQWRGGVCGAQSPCILEWERRVGSRKSSCRPRLSILG